MGTAAAINKKKSGLVKHKRGNKLSIKEKLGKKEKHDEQKQKQAGKKRTGKAIRKVLKNKRRAVQNKITDEQKRERKGVEKDVEMKDFD
jgi:hypothetical protein